MLEIAVTKAALGRLIGTRDSMAMDEAFGRFRRRYDRPQAMAFFAASFQALPAVPAARTQREATLRTLLIMLVAAVTGDRAETICRGGGSQLARTLEFAPAGLRRLALRAIQDSSAGTARVLFASRFGNELKGASTRLAAAALLSRYGDPAVWNSINALQGVFSS